MSSHVLWRSQVTQEASSLANDLEGQLLPPVCVRPGWYLLSTRLSNFSSTHPQATLRGTTVADGADVAIRLSLAPGSRQRLVFRVATACAITSIDFSSARGLADEIHCKFRRLGRIELAARSLWPLMPRPILSIRTLRFTVMGACRLLAAAVRGESGAILARARAQAAFGAGVLDYGAWTRGWASERAVASRQLRDWVAGLSSPPRYSILVPVFAPRIRDLEQCVGSVLAQSYPHWELCIADDASPAAETRELLERIQGLDARIKVAHRDVNGHISKATNSALELATGEFVVLLDQDDLLHPDALAWIALACAERPGAAVLFSDEDKIDREGRRFDPYFKPDINVELLRSQNCVSHLGVYRTTLVRRLGGFREGFEGAQDHDLALRCLDAAGPESFVHVPCVLYHWRASGGSTAQSVEAKPYAEQAALNAVRDHLGRSGVDGAQVSPQRGHFVRVVYPRPRRPPSVEIIVPTRDRLDLVRPCLDSVFEGTNYSEFRIRIVDNGSRCPETLDWFSAAARADRRVSVQRIDVPFNFALLNNAAAAASSADVIVLLNDDVRPLHEDWLWELVVHAIRPDVGAVGALLVHPDGCIQHAGIVLGVGGAAAHAYAGLPEALPGQMGRLWLAQEMSAVTAACLAVRRDRYLEVGGMDESLAVAFNDVDLCLRLRAQGFRTIWTPHARLLHLESASRGREATPEALARLRKEQDLLENRWGVELTFDRSYNPNLDHTSQTFALTGGRMPFDADFQSARNWLRHSYHTARRHGSPG